MSGLGKEILRGEGFVKYLKIVLFLMTSGVATAGEQWHWAYAQNCSNRWNLWQGLADVEIQGVNFQAKLNSGKGPRELSIILKGTIKNGKLKVAATELDSDMGKSDYTGSYIHEKIVDGGPLEAVESINLSNGYSMIGLSRTISK